MLNPGGIVVYENLFENDFPNSENLEFMVNPFNQRMRSTTPGFASQLDKFPYENSSLRFPCIKNLKFAYTRGRSLPVTCLKEPIS